MYSNYKPLVDVNTAYGSQKKPDSFRTDDEIKSLIHVTRGTPDDSFDADSLFIIVDNIIRRSNQIVDEVIVMQTSKAHSAVKADEHEKSPKPNFSVPLCIIKQINSEISCCRDLTVDTAHERAISILKMLMNYSSKAKAGLVLAALAIEFGDFLLFAELSQSDRLSKSLAVLKGAPILTKTPELIQQRRAAVAELNSLIRATFQLLLILFELDKMSSSDPKGLASSLVDLAVYWIVMAVIACANKITILRTDDRYKLLDISIYDKKVRFAINSLTNHLNDLRSIKEDGTYNQLLKLWKTPQESMKFLSYLFSLTDTDTEIIDGSYNFNKARINVLENKTIIFFISRKNISDEDIFTMKQIQQNKITRDNNQYKYAIVWVPVLEEGEIFDYETFARFKDMRWYVMKPVSHFQGRKFLKEEWHFKTDTTAVVYSAPEGRELNLNAYHTIQHYGLDAFPFTIESGKSTSDAADWIVPLFKGIADQTIIAKIDKWVTNKSYIFFHGGRDRQWAKQIEDTINAFVKINEEKALAGRAVKIAIKRFDVEENPEMKERFWRGVQGLFLSKLDVRENGDTSKRQIDRLYSYKSEDAWFIFNAGPATVAVGDRYTLSKVAEELGRAWKWAPAIKEFHAAFVEQHEAVSREYLSQLRCSRIDIPSGAAMRLPEKIGCPVCRTGMEAVTSYVCCHASGHHH